MKKFIALAFIMFINVACATAQPQLSTAPGSATSADKLTVFSRVIEIGKADAKNSADIAVKGGLPDDADCWNSVFDDLSAVVLPDVSALLNLPVNGAMSAIEKERVIESNVRRLAQKMSAGVLSDKTHRKCAYIVLDAESLPARLGLNVLNPTRLSRALLPAVK